MQLPQLDNPDRYTGLFVVDFGDSVCVGYTAREVAMLLESEQYADAKVYRIHNARPDGTMELIGVPSRRFQLETGMFFYRRDMQAARTDFERIRRLADETPLPCRAQLLLGVLGPESRLRYVVGLAYPAEIDPDMSRWMLDQQVEAGEYVDGGVGRLATIRSTARVVDSAQLHAARARQSRSREEVFAAVGRPVQRTA
ncbi:MAG: hypothetical protein ACYS5V_00950 [Planctomycetota bacterium]|jgi:hypothetical protein